MVVKQSELDSFHRFASERLRNGSADLSWHELFHLWQLDNPTTEEHAEINAAIRQSLQEIDAGLARPASEVMDEIRQEFGFSRE